MQINSNIIPDFVNEIAQTLKNNGYEAYLVGGPVRDILMDKTPKDYDITTNATPDKLVELFPQSILTGIKFGTVMVLANKADGEKEVVDVTTYRSEEDYVNGRWPAKVEFATSIEADLSRRDFTINAMAVDLVSGNDEIVDPFHGQEDIAKKIIRAVGNPVERFNEDGLRPFRACRLASILGFEIEENTFNAISQCIDTAKQVSIERIQTEFKRMVYESPKPSVGIELMRKSGLLALFLPELLEGYGMFQNEFHKFDVYHHLISAMDIAPKDIRIAALLHDIAKPRKKSGEHFYGHDIEGEKMVREILSRLKFSKNETERTARLVRWHMFYYPETKEEIEQRLSKETNETIDKDVMEKERKHKRNESIKAGWSDNAIRRFIMHVGGEKAIEQLIELRIADAMSTNPDKEFNSNETGFAGLQERISEVLMEDNAFKISDLRITGGDLMNLGIQQGPEIKRILEELLEKVIEDPKLNTPEQLTELAKGLVGSS